VPGGIILFDEYNDSPWPGCNQAVDEFLVATSLKLEPITRDNYEKYSRPARISAPFHDRLSPLRLTRSGTTRATSTAPVGQGFLMVRC
jgi:hypothetical protein